jgi:hypothetical protein
MIAKKFYQILVDPEETARWYLGYPVSDAGDEIDPRLFTRGEFVSLHSRLKITVRRAGEKIDFNLCDFDMIVVTRLVTDILKTICEGDVQIIPVDVCDEIDSFDILNICRRVQCFDRSRSIFTEWQVEDGRDDKVGRLRMVVDFKIDAAKVGNMQIFRVDEWPIAIIISGEVKNLLCSSGVRGIVFEQV